MAGVKHVCCSIAAADCTEVLSERKSWSLSGRGFFLARKFLKMMGRAAMPQNLGWLGLRAQGTCLAVSTACLPA